MARRTYWMRLVLAAAAAALLSGCPLPFDFNARGAGSSDTVDPSSPKMTAPVIISSVDTGGTSGSGDFTSALTTTVTLSTPTANATIYYTDDGTNVTDYSAAKKSTPGSPATQTITRTTSLQQVVYHAVAIGPNMVPSPQVTATISVTPYPILTISRNVASTSESGGTATFTITSSAPSSSPITVQLKTGGAYSTTYVSGVPALPVSGGTFSVTLGASAATATVTIACTTDPDIVDNDISLAIQPDTINSPPTYSVGSPSTASVLIIDNKQVSLTLSADRSMMNDTQTATFTVTASVPAPSNIVVNLSAAGYAGGTLNVPSTVTILAGATSAQFQVTANVQVGYPTQSPTISIASGAAYTLGTPSSRELMVTDVAYAFTGQWDFSQGLSSGVAGANAWSLSGGVSLVGGSLDFPGNYSSDVAQNDVSAIITQNLFTVGVGFQVSSLPSGTYGRAILSAGASSRWFIIRVDPAGEIWVDLNNHGQIPPAPIDTGFAITAGTDHTILVSVDVVNLALVAIVDGVRHSFSLPTGFTWISTSASEMVFYNNDYSSGGTMAGLWHWMYLTTGAL